MSETSNEAAQPKKEYTKEEKRFLAEQMKKWAAGFEHALNDCHEAGLEVNVLRSMSEGRQRFTAHVTETYCYTCDNSHEHP